MNNQMDLWLGNRKIMLVLNREDMISLADRNAWAVAAEVNMKRRARGLLPHAVSST